ncbi:lipopolysaccharide biosynthesis protein [Alloacidobacterium dinghuense]|uniref:lipopolysaccharide biosynthesis protein n=1 Tax=Alloacidobacterium dinghuense TaxID=2763107 RepID=UPI002036CBB2|nr:oligosaccharide flippase family protein [Alloacidobacterium dinghuense]
MAQVIAVISSPLLTRLYKPSDFGALQIFISVMGLALVAATGRYDVAILLPEDEQSSINLIGLSVLCVLFSAAVVTGVVIVCHYHWILPASVLVLRGHLWLLPVSIVGAGMYQVLSYWAMRRSHYKQIATTKFMQVSAQVGTQLGVGLLTHGSIGLLIGDAVGRVVGSGRFLRDLWKEYADQVRAIRLSQMLKLALRYREYPLISLWGALINFSGLALPSLFLAQYYGAQDTGWFALVNRVLGVPAALIGASIAQVYTSEAAKLSRSDPKRLMYIFLKTTRRMLYLGIAPCAVFMMLAPSIFQFIFGHIWYEAGIYARYLGLMFYASFINSPVTMTLSILERQRSQLVWDVSRLALTIGSITLPFHLGFGTRIAILCYGAAMTLMYGIHWTQSYYAIKHCGNRPGPTALAGVAVTCSPGSAQN